MSCLGFSIQNLSGSQLSVNPEKVTVLKVKSQEPRLHVDTKASTSLKVGVKENCSLRLRLSGSLRFSIKDICAVTDGEMTVLSASDMVLRLKNGDYIILPDDE